MALMEELRTDHFAKGWKLFIDSSTVSLKAVLLHNVNQKPSISLTHSVRINETYDPVKVILDLIGYEHYKWNIYGDLNVILFVVGLQLRYTKHMCLLCLLCLWNSRDESNHFIVRE